jgi:hypothetical protein
MHYIWYPHGNHTTKECCIFIDKYTRKKGDNKEVNQKKEEEDQGDRGFQKSKGTVAMIFAGFPGSRRKHQDRLSVRPWR